MDDWRKELNLPEQLQADPTLANYKTPADALQAFLETKSKIGRSLTIPTEDAGPEARQEFLAKIQEKAPELILRPDPDNAEDFWRMAGVPEKPDDYNPPKEVALEREQVDKFREYAQKVGMTQEQFRKGLTELQAITQAQQEQIEQLKREDENRLARAWGAARQEQENIVGELVRRFQDPNNPVEGDLNAAGKLLLANIAKAFAQKGQGGTQPFTPATGLTPDEAREQIGQIRTRLIEEGRELPRSEYKRLNEKLIELQRQLPAA